MMIGKPSLDGLFSFTTSEGVFLLLALFVYVARALVDGHEAYRDFKYVWILFPAVAWGHRHWLLPAIVRLSQFGAGSDILPFVSIVLLLVCFFFIWNFSRSTALEKPTDGPSPYLLPARTSHTRLFPKKHSFSYSYLLVAVPIEWQGSIGSFISTNAVATSAATVPSKRRTWFSIDASDYLDRGTGHYGLKAKLDAFLRSHGVDAAKYTSAWLVTAPGFLGYSFNPISFWYLYRDGQLDAMVLEVNNTFDERRMYFLTTESGEPSLDADNASFQDRKFRSSWVKDFHVSPFNSRKGSYSLSAQEPCFKDGPWIDNTITLKSSKEHAKLVARIFSTRPAIHVQSMSTLGRAWFVASWFWVGFLTSPRILREAARLFFKRNLHVWYRPEVSTKSIGRNETDRERVIEAVFRDFLRDRVSSQGVALRYIAAGNVQPHEEQFECSTAKKTSATGDTLTLHILTPLFYTHIALAPSLAWYVQHNAGRPALERTFDCSSLDQLTAFLSSSGASTSPAMSSPLAFRFLAQQRTRSRAFAGEAAAIDSEHDLDRFVLTSGSYRRCLTYRKAATALALAETTMLQGLVPVWDTLLLLVRIGLVAWAEHAALRLFGAWMELYPVLALSAFDGWAACIYLGVTIGWYMLNREDAS